MKKHSLVSWLGRFWGQPQPTAASRKHRLNVAICSLEERVVPASFVVDTIKPDIGAVMAVRFGEDGTVWTAEKGGAVKVYDNLNDPTPTTVLDIRKNVHNYWDRGLLGMALHPNFEANPYLYVLYAYDADIGGQAPKFGTAEYDSDPFPDPTLPGSTMSGRLSRFRINPDFSAGPEQVMIEDWPQQFTSHSVGHIAFGPDGALYVSGGDGASFTTIDYGQYNNPFNDPVNEGGALRSQDLVSPGDPVSLNGSILRVDPETGAALPSNPLNSNADANAKRVIANGLRNPFRFTFRPGTNEIWIGDVGWDSYEEINRILAAPDAVVENFGWPAYEGPEKQPGYDAADLPLLESLYANPSQVTMPYFSYKHSEQIVPGSLEDAGGSSIAGIAFNTGGNNFPAEYMNALFFSDYSRQAIFVMKAGANGLPDPNQVELLAPGQTGAPIDLQFGPNGDIYYVDVYSGSLKRVSYTDGNANPVPVLDVSTSSGPAPLNVQFDGRSSYDTDPNTTLTYAWDLDGDGAFDDSTAGNPSFSYTTPGNYAVKLRVTDNLGASSIATKTISVSSTNTLQAIIDTPIKRNDYAIGNTVNFSGRALDPQGNPLPASAMTWTIDVLHAELDDPTNVHIHRLQQFFGVASGSFVFPDHEYPSYIEIKLTVTHNGESVTQKIRVDAKAFAVTMNSNIPGVTLSLGSAGVPAPFTRFAFDQSNQTLSAPLTQTVAGQVYQFVNWSDGGGASRTVTINSDRTYTANYQLVLTGPAPTINFSGGFATGADKISLNGGATVVGSALQLTNTVNNQIRSVFTKNKVGVNNFDTVFDLLITDALGDGMTFVIQNQAPTALGYGGGGLGYGGITNSVAIKFDLFNNTGEGNNSTGLYLNGAEPGSTGSDNLNATGIDLRNNNPKRVRLTYNGTTLTLTIRDLKTNTSITRTFTVNIPLAVGGDTAYVGFTASTGGVNAKQEVATWWFNSTTTTATLPAPGNPKVITPGYGPNSTASTPMLATISWDAVTGATGYRVERRNVGASTYSLLTTINNGTTTSYNDTLVTFNRSYNYRVIAFNATGDSPYAPVLRANFPGKANAPTDLKFYVRSATSIKLTWLDAADNEAGYQVYRSIMGGPMTLLTYLPAGSTNFTDTDLNPNSNYKYRIVGYNIAGASSAAETPTIITPTGKAPVVDYLSGFSSTTGLSLNGNATEANNRLRLTAKQPSQVSSVFTKDKVNVSSFTTSFDITQTDALGDGMTFVIQNQAPTAIGYGGGGLGYGGITNSVAIKLDLFDNGGEGTSSTGLYTNGAEPGLVGSTPTTGINLRNANPKRVTLAYNGVTLTQTIRDLVTGASFTRRYTVNITGIVGGNTAYVGFTASTGGVTAVQEVSAWTYVV